MDAEESVYPSKIDWWIGLLLFLLPVLHLPAGIFVLLQGKVVFGLLIIFLGLGMAAFFVALSFPCNYTLTKNRFRLRSGMISEEISLERISEVRESNSIAAAPALSLQRVELRLKDGSFRLISPRDRTRFIAEIREKMAVTPESDRTES